MERIACGNTAEIYVKDNHQVYKLFYPGYPAYAVEQEFENAKIISHYMNNTPKVYDKVTMDGRYGIIYEKLAGHELLKEMMNEQLCKSISTYLLKAFALLHQDLLSKQIAEGIDYRESIKLLYYGKEKEHQKEIELINHLPEGNNLCHGDFHPGNVWRDEDGSLKIIDFMNVCRGPMEYDIARTYMLLTESELPKEMSVEEKMALTKKRKQMGDEYLSFMGYEKNTLNPFLLVIRNAMIMEQYF